MENETKQSIYKTSTFTIEEKDVGRYALLQVGDKNVAIQGIIVELNFSENIVKFFSINENILMTDNIEQIIGIGHHVSSRCFEGMEDNCNQIHCGESWQTKR